MQWELDWGDSVPFLEGVLLQRGECKALENRVFVRDDLIIYWEGFITLSSCRSCTTELVNPIQFQDIVSYIQLYGIEDVEEFVSFIGVMDNVFLKKQQKQKQQ